MKLGFYPRLAWSGIRKNKRLFVPYILAASGTAAVFYIMFYLASGDLLDGMRGGMTAQSTLSLGVFVIVAFALLFLFYCNSFLVRRRYKEFGLYSILGMNRKNISRVLAWETLLTALLSLIGGIFIGALLSKLAEMIFLHMLGGTADYSLHISLPAIKYMLLYFGGIFALIYISSLIKLHRSTVVELVHSESYGEKPVKANPVLGIAGVILLSAAYILAVSIKEPLQALTIFFIAVIMVIVGTYLVFISGSVLLCKILQKNKRYYYTPRHFVSVSSMTYRMKRNGAGLASICILATMVLVTISSTCCLYFGMVDSVNARYPRDINVTFGYDASTSLTEEKADALSDKLVAALGDTERKNILDFRQLSMSGVFENGVFDISERFSGSSNIIDYGKITNLRIVSLSDYNRISGKSETLAGNEVLLHALRTDYGLKTISLGSVETFTVKKTLDTMPLADGSGAEISPTITLVVSDFDKTAERLVDGAGEYVVRLKWICDFDCSDELEDQDKVCNMIAAASENGEFSDKDGSGGWQYLSYESRAAEYADFAAVYGGLFFLGVTLSLVFICAAVLIIYYKQLSEGYEDAQRFEIMQKVGMTKQEIRRSINSQLLTVFFLPLIFAGLHLAFAFPFIRKILYMFSFYNTSFLVWTTVISFFVFAVLYALVYKKTSNTYYKIVS
mgnify:CR=1 FL=1